MWRNLLKKIINNVSAISMDLAYIVCCVWAFVVLGFHNIVNSLVWDQDNVHEVVAI